MWAEKVYLCHSVLPAQSLPHFKGVFSLGHTVLYKFGLIVIDVLILLDYDTVFYYSIVLFAIIIIKV